MVGDTFDLIVATQGITIADTGLTLRSFSTQRWSSPHSELDV